MCLKKLSILFFVNECYISVETKGKAIGKEVYGGFGTKYIVKVIQIFHDKGALTRQQL